MVLLIIVLFIGLLILNKFSYKDKLKQRFLYIFLIFNLIILLMSNFNNTLFEVSDKAYAFYLLYIIIITLTIIIFGNRDKCVDTNVEDFKSKLDYLTSSKYIRVIATFTLFFLLYYFVKFFNFSNEIDDGSIMRSAFYTTFFKNNYEYYFYNLILGSLKSCITLLVAMQLVFKSKKNYFFYLGIIIVALNALIGNGRASLVNFIVYCFILYFSVVNKKISKIKFSNALRFIVICAVFFFFSLVLLYNRMNYTSFWSSIPKMINVQLESINVYYIGGFRNLDIYLQNGFDAIKDFTIVRSTFGGIDEILCTFLNFIGINCDAYNVVVGGIMQTPNIIGNGVTFNAFYTCIMNFYSDLGLLGIVFYSFLFGILTIIIFNKYQKHHKIFDLALLLFFLVNILICSSYRWFLQSASTMFTIFVLLFLSKHEDKIFKKNK